MVVVAVQGAPVVELIVVLRKGCYSSRSVLCSSVVTYDSERLSVEWAQPDRPERELNIESLREPYVFCLSDTRQRDPSSSRVIFVDINGEYLLTGIREGYLELVVYGYSRKCTLWSWMVSPDFGCKLYYTHTPREDG